MIDESPSTLALDLSNIVEYHNGVPDEKTERGGGSFGSTDSRQY